MKLSRHFSSRVTHTDTPLASDQQLENTLYDWLQENKAHTDKTILIYLWQSYLQSNGAQNVPSGLVTNSDVTAIARFSRRSSEVITQLFTWMTEIASKIDLTIILLRQVLEQLERGVIMAGNVSQRPDELEDTVTMEVSATLFDDD